MNLTNVINRLMGIKKWRVRVKLESGMTYTTIEYARDRMEAKAKIEQTIYHSKVYYIEEA